jgi:anti-sigma factor RsiW
MKHSEATELMHAVLDGEASAEESRTLQRLLDSDADARAEFAALERLFKVLHSVPQQYPPEGLVAAVTAALPRETKRHAVSRQPLAGSRVVRHASSDTLDAIRGDAETRQPARRSEPPTRSNFMSQQHSGLFAKRRTWIGAAIAAAAVVAVAQYGFDFPPRGEDVLGTIVPAQRYRAPQATAQDIKVDGQAVTPSTTPAVPTAQTDSANVAAESATKSATESATKSATEAATKSATESATKSATEAATKSATEAATKSATEAATKSATEAATKSATEAAAKSATEAAAKSATEAATKSATEAAAKAATQHAAQAATQQAAQAAAQQAAQAAANSSTK